MNKYTIWKYKLDQTGKIEMPTDAEILCIQVQRGEPHIWALVNPENKLETRKFKVYGTGHPCPEDPGIYVGTFQLNDIELGTGCMVLHVFEDFA